MPGQKGSKPTIKVAARAGKVKGTLDSAFRVVTDWGVGVCLEYYLPYPRSYLLPFRNESVPRFLGTWFIDKG